VDATSGKTSKYQADSLSLIGAVALGTGIAALGIIYYLIMDIAIHWGVLRHHER
jgi:hypothetical protein